MTEGERITIPARRGKAVVVAMGQSVKVVNTHGQQVVDTWAYSRGDMTEFMSMEHSRASFRRYIPRLGDAFVTNRRRSIVTLVEDTSPRSARHPDRRLRPLPLRESWLHQLSRQLHRQPHRGARGVGLRTTGGSLPPQPIHEHSGDRGARARFRGTGVAARRLRRPKGRNGYGLRVLGLPARYDPRQWGKTVRRPRLISSSSTESGDDR